MSRIKIALPLAIALCAGVVRDARAWVQFCNGTDVTIWTAYSWYDASCVPEDGSTWAKEGWWELSPGECRVVYGPAITNPYSYYYGEGDGVVWSGDFQTCTPETAFIDWCLNTCTTGSRILGYRELYSGDAENYTVTFTR